jgi:hypothetical protein
MQSPETVQINIPFPLTNDRQLDEVLRVVAARDEALLRELIETRRVLNGRVGFGFNDVAGGELSTDNVEGVWARVTLNDPAQLGAATTVTHNFGLPVISSGGGTPNNLPNVRWWPMAWLYGVLDGSAAAPAAPGANPGLSVMFRIGDTVGADSLQLRFYSSLVPAATSPLTVDLYLIPAVR